MNKKIKFENIPSVIVLKGDSKTAYRDPLLHYHHGIFRLFCSVVILDSTGKSSFYIASLESTNLVSWTQPKAITKISEINNFCGPGSIIFFRNSWVMCLSSYPHPNVTDARCWTMSSNNLDSWSEPQPMQLKGSNIPVKSTGRTLDPYIFRDKDSSQKWWCFYKQGGILINQAHSLAFGGMTTPPDTLLLQSLNLSYSYDLKNWTPYTTIDGEENYCVILDNNEYVLIDSPGNGIGVRRSRDLVHWYDECLYTLGQREWLWAHGRLTAAHVLDLRNKTAIGKYLVTFHGATLKGRISTGFHGSASIGLAWTDNLIQWSWAGQGKNAANGST